MRSKHEYTSADEAEKAMELYYAKHQEFNHCDIVHNLTTHKWYFECWYANDTHSR